MKKIIIFGASKGGLNYIKNQNEYAILVAVDNDENKHNTLLNGDIKVIPPSEIHSFSYDIIVVTSMYGEAITKQLIEELHVEPTLIYYAPKRLMKTVDAIFEDFETLDLAKKMLFRLVKFLEEKNYTYYLNFGTLLGIVREGRLLPWDDDIDLAVQKNFHNEEYFINELKQFFKSFSAKTTFILKSDDLNGLLGIDVEVESEITLPYTISIDLLREDEEYSYLPIDAVPTHFFEKQDTVLLDGVPLKTPSPHKEYLTHVYKDWHIVKKEVSFQDNTTTYNEPKNMKLNAMKEEGI